MLFLAGGTIIQNVKPVIEMLSRWELVCLFCTGKTIKLVKQNRFKAYNVIKAPR
jgi:hypothetical protein